MLKKQSIRQGVYVLINGVQATKEELIILSETWTEKKEVFFRKMLQKGGNFRMDGKDFIIKIRENKKTKRVIRLSQPKSRRRNKKI